jgi:hypothetical protein
LTYSDLRFGEGDIYGNNGFVLTGTTAPDYYYTDFEDRYNRFKFRANEGRSEKDIAAENGVCKIFGIGSNIYQRSI